MIEKETLEIKDLAKDIKVDLEIPFIFRVNFAKYGFSQYNFGIKVLPFSLSFHLCSGAGWSITPDILRWCFELRSHLKRIIIIFRIGIPQLSILQWQISRLEKKLYGRRIP